MKRRQGITIALTFVGLIAALGCGAPQTATTRTASTAPPQEVSFSRLAAFGDNYVGQTVITEALSTGVMPNEINECQDGEMMVGLAKAGPNGPDISAVIVFNCVPEHAAGPILDAEQGAVLSFTAVVVDEIVGGAGIGLQVISVAPVQ